MKLLSDYRQWYDEIFDDRPPIFQRQAFTEGGLPKRAQLELFRSLGLRTPDHGQVCDLHRRLGGATLGATLPRAALAEVQLVVYLNELAHRGDGKLLLPLVDAASQYPDRYATVFHPQPPPRCILRLVRFGQLTFWLRQTGQPNEWRSNRGDSETVLAKERVTTDNPLPRVLWAIDFLPTPGSLLAIDFNTAPELSTLGELGQLTPNEVAQELDRVAATAPDQLQQF